VIKAVKLLTAALTVSSCLRAAPVVPLVFEAAPKSSSASFIARTPEGSVLLGKDGALLIPAGADSKPVRMTLGRARARKPEAEQPLASVSNYFTGSDSAQWRTGVRQFAKIRYTNVHPGVDVVYYGSGGRLEYDVILAPGATHGPIEVAFEGADKISTDSRGDLLIEAGSAVIRQQRPHVYQLIDGSKKLVTAEYRVLTSNRIQFELGQFDPSRHLIIDPVIQYSTYLGKSGQDSAVSVAVDKSGNAFVAGETNSIDLAVGNPLQNYRSGDTDAFVAKINASGLLEFVTYLGGKKTDTGLGIALDPGGNVLLSGVTFSPDFPVKNPVQETFGGGEFDCFAAKINPNGTQLTWATFLGGSLNEWAPAIASDSKGGAWITGWTTSPDFPLRRPYQGGPAGGGGDVFVSRIAGSGPDLSYSTFVGGEGRDLGSGIAVDAHDIVYVTGGTTSSIFPFTKAVQERSGGGQDAFLFALDPEKNDLVFATLLGGSGDDLGTKVAADGSGNAYVAGYTQSPNFPVTRGAAQGSPGGMYDVFVAKVSAGSLGYATLAGGNGDDWPGGIVVDAAGSAYVAGWTNSGNFPTKNAFQTTYASGTQANARFDATVFRLSPGGDTFLYSSFLGGSGEDKAYGIAMDPSGRVVVAGSTTSRNFPSASNEFNAGSTATFDAFVARLSADATLNSVTASAAEVRIAARTGDPATAPVKVELRATGSPLSFSAGASVPWLRLSPESGTTPATLTVEVDRSQLQPGTNSAEITVHAGTSTLRIPVTIDVSLAPAITDITPRSLVRGSADSPVVVKGGGFVAGSYVEINGARLPSTVVDASTIQTTVPASMIVSEASLPVVVVNPDGRSNQFDLLVTATGPSIGASGVVHAATNAAGPVAPGEIVVINGTGFGPESLVQAAPADGRYGTSLDGLRVLFDGTAAPVLWSMNGRVAVVVPYGVSGHNSVQIAVEWRGQQSVAVSAPVQQANPGLFSADSSGRGQAAALNQDGSYNSVQNPAAPGSVVVFYGTGAGQLDPVVPDGSIVPVGNSARPVLTPTVLIGGIPATVEYAGPAPGQVTGLIQLNVRVPETVPPGDSVPVAVFGGGFASPSAGATMAVR
jgi:uncharacterized protein (TIGR03437 family)